jgi:FAD/FMN-containing dehydrogenase
MQCFVFGHIADGNLHLVITRADGMSAGQEAAVKQAVYGPLEQLAGSVSAEHGIGFEKRDYLPLSRRPEEIMCMRMLKQTFDPAGLLNPGRILKPV